MSSQSPFSVSELMSEREYFLIERIWSQIRENRGCTGRVLYGCPLSKFVNPNHKLIESKEERALAFHSILVAAVVRKAKDSPLVFAVISANSPHAQGTQRLLAKFNVASEVLNLDEITDVVVNEVCRSVEKAYSSIGKATGTATNKSEHRAFKLTQSTLGQSNPTEKFHIYLDLAASLVISHATASQPSPEVASMFHYLCLSSFDMVVATPPPLSHPLLAIQVDGGVHQELRKRENDRKMDNICALANLPLIRINDVDYPNFWSGAEGEWQEFINQTSHRFLSYLIRHHSKFGLYAVQAIAIEQRRLHLGLDRYRQLADVVQRKRPDNLLSNEERIRLFLHAEDELGITDERNFDAFEYSHSELLEAEGCTGLCINELSRYGMGAHVRISWREDRCMASVIIYDLATAAHCTDPISLPPVRISGVGIQMENELIESFMIEEGHLVALATASRLTGE